MFRSVAPAINVHERRVRTCFLYFASKPSPTLAFTCEPARSRAAPSLLQPGCARPTTRRAPNASANLRAPSHNISTCTRRLPPSEKRKKATASYTPYLTTPTREQQRPKKSPPLLLHCLPSSLLGFSGSLCLSNICGQRRERHSGRLSKLSLPREGIPNRFPAAAGNKRSVESPVAY